MQGRQRFDDRLVDSAGALASAHDQEREEILAQPEPLPREFLIDGLKLFADRRAGYFSPRFRKKRRAFLEAEQNGAHHPGGQSVGLPWNGVRFVNESWNPAHLPGEHRCGGSKAAHAENRVRLELAINPAAKPEAFRKTPREAEDGRGERRRQPNRGQPVKPKLRSPGERQSVDFLFGNEKHHLVAAGPQHFGNRQAGKQVPARSATCNHGVHRIGPIGLI
jgi:hypothetical protein